MDSNLDLNFTEKLHSAFKTALEEIYQDGYNAGKAAAAAAVETENAAKAVAEEVEAKEETSTDNEQQDQQEVDPINYRHAYIGDDKTLCGENATKLEVATGDRVNCPKCLAALEVAERQ